MCGISEERLQALEKQLDDLIKMMSIFTIDPEHLAKLKGLNTTDGIGEWKLLIKIEPVRVMRRRTKRNSK